MNNVITIADFTGRYAISAGKYRIEQFNSFINELQEKHLICFLGVTLYNELASDYALYPAIPLPAKWTNFLNGADFNSYQTGFLLKFEGFKKILVKIVFAEWLLFSRDFVNETGAFESQNENSIKLNIRRLRNKSNEVYNDAVNNVITMYDYLLTNISDFTNFDTYFNFLSCRGSAVKTLY